MVIPRRSLRAMKARWERDLTRLEDGYPMPDWRGGTPEIETMRNLATAIAQIDGVIAAYRPGDAPSTPNGDASQGDGR